MEKYHISLCVPGLPFNGDTLSEGSLGGSETAALYMAQALARAGHDVKVFCNGERESVDSHGVSYYPLPFYQQYATGTPHDITIVQRAPQMFSVQNAAKLNILWCHDLALRRESATFKGALWNIDKVLVLSDFMRKQYAEVHGDWPGLYHVTRNGIDPKAMTTAAAMVPTSRRNRKAVLFTSRPERGLDNLVRRVMPMILARVPDAELWIAGYANDVEHLAEFRAGIAQSIQALQQAHGAKVVDFGALNKAQLYALMREAGVYVYPSPSQINAEFAEVSCITAMECMGNGLPMVLSDVGALRETADHGSAVMIDCAAGHEAWTDKTAEKFALAAVDLMLLDGKEFKELSLAGEKRAAELTWDGVAEEWSQMFEREIGMRNRDTNRRFRHFWRQSDIVAAKQMHDAEKSAGLLPAAEIAAREAMLAPFAFAFEGPDGFRKQYERISKTHTPESFEAAPHEPRFPPLVQWLKSAVLKREDGRTEPIQTVLDYGCGLGSYAAFCAQATGLHFTAVDFDKRAIEIAEEYAYQRHGMTADQVTYECLDAADPERDWPSSIGEKWYDAALAQEVLEHVLEPWALAERVESRVKPGGWVYLTVPLGPWELASYHTYPWRCHIWHFDFHDLRDMFGQKDDFAADSLVHGRSEQTGEALGWWIVRYRADHSPVGRIDMSRKFRLARPRQTVSVNLIAGPGSEENILWTLRSVYNLADEIIIGDCGGGKGVAHAINTLDALNPLWRWRELVRVVPAPNPRQYGFDEARNAVLDQSRMDWVLWIDTDERLISPEKVQKYLRENIFDGYGVRQHHFACDTQLSIDMPVRLFRRAHRDGKVDFRFIGSIHEHPERGLNNGPGDVVVMTDAHIAHVGYLIENTRQNRFVRNYPLLKLDQEKHPERLLQKHFLMRDYVQLVRFALQQYGRIDESMKEKLREVVKLYQENFLGKPGYTNANSQVYYSEALAMLGEGFDVSFQVAADKTDSSNKAARTIKGRYASHEDFQKDLDRIARDETAGLVEKWW